MCSKFPRVRAIFRNTKYSHVTPILKSLHWLKVKERIVYKTVSLTYKSIITPGQSYMSHLIEVKQPATTRSSKLITLERPSIPLRCKLSSRSLKHMLLRRSGTLFHPLLALLFLCISPCFLISSFIDS